MGSYVRFMREMERGDRLQEAAANLAAKLKAGETVRVSSRRELGALDVEEHAYCNDVSTEEACDRLALNFVEEWVRYEWVNS